MFTSDSYDSWKQQVESEMDGLRSEIKVLLDKVCVCSVWAECECVPLCRWAWPMVRRRSWREREQRMQPYKRQSLSFTTSTSKLSYIIAISFRQSTFSLFSLVFALKFSSLKLSSWAKWMYMTKMTRNWPTNVNTWQLINLSLEWPFSKLKHAFCSS